MRNAILSIPEQRTVNEHRQVLRAAIRQLERAEIYLASVVYMDLGDPGAERSLAKMRSELDGLRRHLSEQRAGNRP